MLTNYVHNSNNHFCFEKGSTSLKPWELYLKGFVLACPWFVIFCGFAVNLPILHRVSLEFFNNKTSFRIEMKSFNVTHCVLRKATTCHNVARCLITLRNMKNEGYKTIVCVWSRLFIQAAWAE